MEQDRKPEDQTSDISNAQSAQQPSQAQQQPPSGQQDSERGEAGDSRFSETGDAGLPEGDTLTEQRSETDVEGSSTTKQPTGEDGSGFVGSASESDSSDELIERDDR